MEKLNKRGIGARKEGAAAATSGGSAAPDGDLLQLDADVQQSLNDIVIVVPLPGVELSELQIFVEGVGDVVVIQGERKRPDVLTAKSEGAMKTGETSTFLQRECKWGQFYRKIVLPVEIDIARTRASLGKGVLILTLPFKKAAAAGSSGTPVQVVEGA